MELTKTEKTLGVVVILGFIAWLIFGKKSSYTKKSESNWGGGHGGGGHHGGHHGHGGRTFIYGGGWGYPYGYDPYWWDYPYPYTSTRCVCGTDPKGREIVCNGSVNAYGQKNCSCCG